MVKAKIRASIAILVLVFSCLHQSRQFLRQASQIEPKILGKDLGTLEDQRFAAIRHDLPKSGVIGYVEDPASGNGAAYMFAQYALSPLILDAHGEQDVVVGNSFHSENKPAFSAWPDVRIVKDYRNGIFLLKRRN